jgi:sorting nexin-8
MSLFGTSPDESPAAAAPPKSRISLFDDEPSPAPGSKSSLFDDDAPGSPWDMPTPKKAPRAELIKHLLPTSDVPESYIDIFDNVANGGDGTGGKITATGIAKVLSAGKLSADDQSRIVSLISSGGQLSDVTRNEFNVLLALIGLAQEHEEITLDGVDERRRNLPEPKLPSFSTVQSVPDPVPEALQATPPRPATPPQQVAPVSPQKNKVGWQRDDGISRSRSLGKPRFAPRPYP